jgi:hypothetical protein
MCAHRYSCISVPEYPEITDAPKTEDVLGGPGGHVADGGEAAAVISAELDPAQLIDELGLITQDANISFLVGAGTSRPGFKANSNIESWLDELDGDDSPKAIRARASIYAHFLAGVGQPSKDLAEGKKSKDLTTTLDNYQRWLGSLHRMLLRRRGSILSKQANVFTTNVDLAIEIAAELAEVEINDGFAGRSRFGAHQARGGKQSHIASPCISVSPDGS